MKIVCPDYLAFVRSHLCVGLASCLGNVVAHHLVARGRGDGKRNDFTAVPLCVRHHAEIHSMGYKGFDTYHKVNVWREATWLLIEFFTDEIRRTGVNIRFGKK